VRAGRRAWMDGRQFPSRLVQVPARGKGMVTLTLSTSLGSLTASRAEGRADPEGIVERVVIIGLD
jgi:hypothetical protein